MSSPPVFKFKVVTLGDASVGKSSIMYRFTWKRFCENVEPTIGAAYMQSVCNLPNATIQLQCWDTAGSERFAPLMSAYYRAAPCAVVVYDITSEKTFQKAQEWFAEIRNHCSPNCQVMLLGNKLDLQDRREVATGDGKSFAAANNALFMECSAKDGTNVEEAFEMLGNALHKKAIELGMAPETEEQDEGGLKPIGGKPGGCCKN